MTDNSHVAFYKPYFDAWQVKVFGPKPTAEQLALVHGLGLAPGKQAMACAMSLRDCGVTGPQIVMVCGAPQLNRMRGLIEGGLFKRHVVQRDGLEHTVYKCSVTPAGHADIKRRANFKANATASTAKPKAKPAKAAPKAAKPDKAKPVAAPVQAAKPEPAKAEKPAKLQSRAALVAALDAADKAQANVKGA